MDATGEYPSSQVEAFLRQADGDAHVTSSLGATFQRCPFRAEGFPGLNSSWCGELFVGREPFQREQSTVSLVVGDEIPAT